MRVGVVNECGLTLTSFVSLFVLEVVIIIFVCLYM